MKMFAAIVLSTVVAAPVFAQSRENNGPQPRFRAGATTDQVIVKWRNGSGGEMAKPAAQRASKLSAATGIAIKHQRRSGPDSDVFKLDRSMNTTELQTVLEQLNADPDVAVAVADQRRRAQRLTSDPKLASQWYLLSAEAAAIRADEAWDVTMGSNTTVVAVLDSGIRYDHPELSTKLLPGYDFVTRLTIANDGDGRDADASDPGDWVTTADRSQPDFTDCDAGASSWHGTRVASLIAASTDNGVGMAAAGWNTVVLPVRVLGKCGGFDSDIIDGMRWAAGLPVLNAPTNPTPAKIINLSLGGEGVCNAVYQAAIDEVTASGALVVASTGNDATVVAAPANCGNVLSVGAVRHVGTKVGYSNLGPSTDLSAPGGNCGSDGGCTFPIVSATNAGQTAPTTSTYTDETVTPATNLGTSFSAPLVASAAALMHTVNPRLSPAQFATLLKESATPFPTSSTTATAICRVPVSVNDIQGAECICTTSTCGAGLLNVASAVKAAQKPFGIVQAPSTIDPSTSVNIDGRTSFDVDGDPVTAYQWSIVNVTGVTPTIADIATGTTTLQVTGNSRFTLRLRVTDDAGIIDDTDFAIVTTTPPEPPPAPLPSTPIGGGGGGGGSFDWWLLVLGLLPLAFTGPRRRKAVRARGRALPRDSALREVQELYGSARRSYRSRRRQNFPQ